MISKHGSIRRVSSLEAIVLWMGLWVSGCGHASETPEWCSTPSEGAAVIRLSGEDDRQDVRLTELWRIGGTDGEHVFAEPGRPSVSALGRVAIPDMMNSSVVLVEADGRWTGPVLRKGDGPGEVRWPVDAEFLSEDRLAVFDLAKGTVSTVSTGGQLLGEPWRIDASIVARISAEGSLPGEDLVPDGSLLLEPPWEPVPNEARKRQARVLWLHPNGPEDTLQAQSVPVLGKPPFASWALPGASVPLFAAGGSGPVAVAGADSHYRIRVLSHAGTDSILICRTVGPVPYAQEERGEAVDDPGLRGALQEASLPDSPASIGGMFAGEGGRLWVVRERPSPGNTYPFAEGAHYDVFGPGGVFLGTVHAPAHVFLFGEGGHHVYGFERGQYDELTLVAYAMPLGDA